VGSGIELSITGPGGRESPASRLNWALSLMASFGLIVRCIHGSTSLPDIRRRRSWKPSGSRSNRVNDLFTQHNRENLERNAKQLVPSQLQSWQVYVCYVAPRADLSSLQSCFLHSSASSIARTRWHAVVDRDAAVEPMTLRACVRTAPALDHHTACTYPRTAAALDRRQAFEWDCLSNGQGPVLTALQTNSWPTRISLDRALGGKKWRRERRSRLLASGCSWRRQPSFRQVQRQAVSTVQLVSAPTKHARGSTWMVIRSCPWGSSPDRIRSWLEPCLRPAEVCYKRSRLTASRCRAI
jgi:hypothetical protein